MLFYNKYLQFTGLFVFLAFQNVQAAKEINLRHQSSSILSNYTVPKTLGAKNANHYADMKIVKRDMDFNRTTHIKIQQTYHDYPVWGGNVILHVPYSKENASKFANPFLSAPPSTKMNGSLYKELDQDLSYAPPFIFNKQQIDKARTYLINHYLTLEKPDKIVHTNDKMLVYIDHGKARWAFKFDFAITRPHRLPQRPTFIIDALTFAMFKHWDEMQYLTANDDTGNESQGEQTPQDQLDEVKGGGFGGNLNGINIYDGMRGNKDSLNIQRDSSKHICYMRNEDVLIKKFKYDPENWTYVGDVIQYKCEAPDTNHGNTYWNAMFDATKSGGLSPANDALYAASIVNEMYQDLYNVPVLRKESIEPFDLGDGDEVRHMMIKINLHADRDISGNVAGFDPFANELILGDGDGEKFYPLVSLDVIAHELSHGFTQRYAGFIKQGQAAAINEAFSDMATQVAQYYATTNHKNTWKIGADILVTPRKGQALRYMDNPRKDCLGVGREERMCSIDNAKDYKDYMNEHHACGVFNKAFYLLSTSPNWDVKKAFDVMIQANMRYWLPTSDFSEAACGVLDAAKDYGYEPDAIQKAFAAVGIETNKC